MSGNVVSVRCGKTIASICVNGISLNEELLRAGLAWHYKCYSQHKELAKLEDEARAKEIGLCSNPNTILPTTVLLFVPTLHDRSNIPIL